MKEKKKRNHNYYIRKRKKKEMWVESQDAHEKKKKGKEEREGEGRRKKMPAVACRWYFSDRRIVGKLFRNIVFFFVFQIEDGCFSINSINFYFFLGFE